MSSSRLSNVAGNWFVIISCALFWTLSLAAVVFYRFQLMPTINRIRAQQEVSGERPTDLELPFVSNRAVESFPEIDSIFRTTRDSLERHNKLGFAADFAQGSIEIFRESDSEAVLLKYYLDCGCPLEDNRLDMVCYPVDLSGVPKKLDPVIYEGVSKSAGQTAPPLRSLKPVAKAPE